MDNLEALAGNMDTACIRRLYGRSRSLGRQ